MINAIDLRDQIIKPVLALMAPLYNAIDTPAAVNLLLGTAIYESTINDQTYLREPDDGAGLGIYKITQRIEQDVWLNYLHNHPARADQIQHLLAKRLVVGGSPLDLIGNLPYQTAIARVIYCRSDFTWPDNSTDLDALSLIWKQYWNTHSRPGRPKAWVAAFPVDAMSRRVLEPTLRRR